MRKLVYFVSVIFLQTICVQNVLADDIHVITRAVITQRNHILCAYDPRLKTSEGTPVFYYLPGGHIEYQEGAVDALARELLEETGQEILVQGFIGSFERSWLTTPQSVKCHKHEISLVFKASFHEQSSDALPVITSKEPHKVAFAWLPLETINTYELRPALLKDNLETWLAMSSDHAFKSVMHIK